MKNAYPNLGRVRELLEDFDIVATTLNVALVGQSARHSSLRENVAAAVIASSMNLSSLDYAKKRYVRKTSDIPSVDKTVNLKDQYVNTYFSSKNYMAEVRSRLVTPNTDLPSDAVFGASLVLERLAASFFSAHLLYCLGHSYEGHAVSRLILEQIAWSVAAYSLADKSDVTDIVTTKAISELKKLVPEAGLLYGFLSNKTHIDHSSHLEFLDVQNGANVVRYFHHEFEEYALVLVRLTDFFVIAWEFTQRDFLKTFDSLNFNLEEVSLVKNRPFLLKMNAIFPDLF